MIKNNLISVVIPVYNVEKFLERCVLSVLNQNYKNIEIILVDDGSTDSSGVICDKLEQKSNIIKVYHKENGGLSDARNYGLERIKGQYVCFVDSDDILKANYIETLYNLLIENDADISQCDFARVNDSLEFNQTIPIEVKCFNNIEMLYNLYNENAVATTVAWNKLYKVKMFNDIKYPVGKLNEDEGTTYKLIYESQKIVITNEVLYLYYMSDNSIMRSSFNIRRLDYLDFMRERINYFNERKLFELQNISILHLFLSIIRFIKLIEENKIRDKNSVLKKLKESKKKCFIYIMKSSDFKCKTKLRIFSGYTFSRTYLKLFDFK